MLGRTKMLWRRLLASPEQAGDLGQTAVEDRRVWVRHPADLKATCQSAEDADADRLSARVRNLSVGGISLVVNRPFEPGEMVSIELPDSGEGSTSTVLACVVHVNRQGEEEWALGCTFSRELSDEDLQAFGAQRVKHSASDQRTWMRFATNVTASYQIITAPDPSRLPTQVLNISATGIGLLVTQAVTVGALLSLELRGAAGSAERTMLACVVHVTQRGEGEWGLGCNFIRSLSEADLKELL